LPLSVAFAAQYTTKPAYRARSDVPIVDELQQGIVFPDTSTRDLPSETCGRRVGVLRAILFIHGGYPGPVTVGDV